MHGTKVVHSGSSVTVLELNKGKELKAILNVLGSILGGTKNAALYAILEMVHSMNCQLSMNADRVNFLEWLASVNGAMKLTGGNHDSPLALSIYIYSLNYE